MGFKILAINPGSTSTKIALYDDEQPTLALTLRHSAEEIARFPRIIDQLDWRKEMVLEALAKNNFDVKSLSAVIGRGGLILVRGVRRSGVLRVGRGAGRGAGRPRSEQELLG